MQMGGCVWLKPLSGEGKDHHSSSPTAFMRRRLLLIPSVFPFVVLLVSLHSDQQGLDFAIELGQPLLYLGEQLLALRQYRRVVEPSLDVIQPGVDPARHFARGEDPGEYVKHDQNC